MAKFQVPKKPAAAADLLYSIREQRYALQKQVAELKAQEAEITDFLINTLPASDATGVSGKLARVTIVSNTVAQVNDWDALYDHILKTGKKNPGVFALLQRRVGDKAVKDVWDAGKTVPGVEPFGIKTLSLNKVS